MFLRCFCASSLSLKYFIAHCNPRSLAACPGATCAIEESASMLSIGGVRYTVLVGAGQSAFWCAEALANALPPGAGERWEGQTTRPLRRGDEFAIRGFREGQAVASASSGVSQDASLACTGVPSGIERARVSASARRPSKRVLSDERSTFSHQAEREKANENLLMVLGGTLGGPISRWRRILR